MRRHDIPEQHLVLDPELGQRAMDNRGRRLGRAAAGQLTLAREWDPADSCAAVTRRFSDEDDRGVPPPLQIGDESLPPTRGPSVLVEGRADPCRGKRGDELLGL
jgi:hypothetical protein